MDGGALGLIVLGAMLLGEIVLLIWHARFLAAALERIEGIASATFLETRKARG